ncbi:predicted protein [Botrytis cinerea T4]|uniref:Uncharacterized protein n=1 Tax=Botryotinia fuckeliana (strain T4) TaxID=999810 RepID=G2YZK0_BOTF4|nr:predicted protein [Botrytis cinerea T4]
MVSGSMGMKCIEGSVDVFKTCVLLKEQHFHLRSVTNDHT